MNEHRVHSASETRLEMAARAALKAPSVFNTQPWIWRISGSSMQLWSDPARQLENTDPDGHLLLISCGAALHHARIALAAAGRRVQVDRLPDPAQPRLLARLRIDNDTVRVDPETARLAAAIDHRRTDRRAFGAREVPGAVIDRLRQLVEAHGCYLHLVRSDQVCMLAISAELAAAAESEDPDYQAELERWTLRGPWSGDGVPRTTAVVPGLRRVPVRDFAPDGTAGLDVGQGRDQGAAYVIVYGVSTRPVDLLRAGEALSALLLSATADGLSTAPLSDAVEVTWPRHLLRGLLAGTGEPYIVVRLGYRDAERPLPATPRRNADQIIEFVD